jgi:hypothetical protein
MWTVSTSPDVLGAAARLQLRAMDGKGMQHERAGNGFLQSIDA